MIEPREEIPAKLARCLTEGELLLCCSPQLMSHEFGDRSGWTDASIRVVVKLAYLVQTLDIFEDENRRVEIFGAPDISEELFDRWWSIRQIEYLGRATESSEELAALSGYIRPGEDPIVANWLQQMMAK